MVKLQEHGHRNSQLLVSYNWWAIIDYLKAMTSVSTADRQFILSQGWMAIFDRPDQPLYILCH